MNRSESTSWWRQCPGTLGLCAAMVLLNLGLFSGAPRFLEDLISWLQFDRAEILDGQLWRIVLIDLGEDGEPTGKESVFWSVLGLLSGAK